MRLIIIFSTLLFLFSPKAVFAATISLHGMPASVGVGDIVRVDVSLESAVPLNAFSGALSYTATMLEPVAVSDGNSIVNLWITRPVLLSTNEAIPFAGVTPGGFAGSSGKLFSILFRAKVAGRADLSLKDIVVLRNDGAGSNEPATVQGLSLHISTKPLGGYVEPADTNPPEPFVATLGADPQVSGGQYYLSFRAIDKGVGIERYLVAESRTPSFLAFLFPLSWHLIPEEPYILSDQGLTSTTYLKAVDRAGNERLSVFPPRYLFTAYEIIAFLAILVLGILFWQRGRDRRRS